MTSPVMRATINYGALVLWALGVVHSAKASDDARSRGEWAASSAITDNTDRVTLASLEQIKKTMDKLEEQDLIDKVKTLATTVDTTLNYKMINGTDAMAKLHPAANYDDGIRSCSRQ